MKLQVGSSISCEELRKRVDFFWKQMYSGHWERERVRLGRVTAKLKELDERVEVQTVGFGADTDELIENHPDESGAPDLRVVVAKNGRYLMSVEVSGTEAKRGDDYWVRPDKLAYARNNPDHDYFIILHYKEPEEEFIYIRPNADVTYRVSEKEISGARERYVVFSGNDKEVISEDEFKFYLRQKVDELL